MRTLFADSKSFALVKHSIELTLSLLIQYIGNIPTIVEPPSMFHRNFSSLRRVISCTLCYSVFVGEHVEWDECAR